MVSIQLSIFLTQVAKIDVGYKPRKAPSAPGCRISIKTDAATLIKIDEIDVGNKIRQVHLWLVGGWLVGGWGYGDGA